MKIIIPSYQRASTITTPGVFAGGPFDVHVVVHTEEEADAYRAAGRLPEGTQLHVSNTPPGLTHQSRWITSRLVKLGEWFVKADDNIRRLTAVPEPEYDLDSLPVQDDKSLRPLFEETCPPERFSHIVAEMMGECERVGSCYGGFATVPNFYFRGKKWRYVGYVIGKLVVMKAAMFDHFDPNIVAMEDYSVTAVNLLTTGRVVINNFVKPEAGHYETGGIGTYEERLPAKIADAEYLINKYPGLFRYKEKQGCHPKAELQIRFTSVEQVEKWRRRLAGL